MPASSFIKTLGKFEMVPSKPSQLDIKASENLDGIFPKYSHTYKIEVCLEKN